jgi:hypothetical protein
MKSALEINSTMLVRVAAHLRDNVRVHRVTVKPSKLRLDIVKRQTHQDLNKNSFEYKEQLGRFFERFFILVGPRERDLAEKTSSKLRPSQSRSRATGCNVRCI